MPLKEIIIAPDSDGIRVSECVRAALPDLPESTVRRLFSARDVKLDGVRVSREQSVRAGQILKIYVPDSVSTPPSLSVIYEDMDILLVNKRAGISVETDAHGGITLTDLCAEYVSRNNPDAFMPVACHRLDNRTCGLCLFAKNAQAFEILQDMFRSRKLEKYYVCLVRGIMKPPAAICRAWLVKDARRAVVRITDRPEPEAKPIETGYETITSGPVSRLRIHLITGRTHQIRAHLAALGHPVLGDDLYGDREFNRREKARSLKLCAVSLKLNTDGRLPALDGKIFSVDPPF